MEKHEIDKILNILKFDRKIDPIEHYGIKITKRNNDIKNIMTISKGYVYNHEIKAIRSVVNCCCIEYINGELKIF